MADEKRDLPSADQPSLEELKKELWKRKKKARQNFVLVLAAAVAFLALGVAWFVSNMVLCQDLVQVKMRNFEVSNGVLYFTVFVKSDEALEKLGDQAQYANYKVILTAHLANKAGTALVEDVSDYLIYTNAKFYNGIISTRDFD